jgi:hypothetical protein
MAAELSDRDVDVIGQCLKAAALGPFFPDWEFQTLFGLNRGDVAKIASEWPTVDRRNPSVWLAVANSMTNLLGYPHGLEAEWGRYISAPRSELEAIFRKWKSLENPTG